MIRGALLVSGLALMLSGCESWSLGHWKKVSSSSNGQPAKWVYIPASEDVKPNYFVPPEPVAQPAPTPLPSPEPVEAVPAPEPKPAAQPAASSTGGQGGEPKVITCTIC